MPKLPPQPFVHDTAGAHPILGTGLGPAAHSVLGDAGGLTQFGAHIEALPPGSRSSFRHWHAAEDEFIMVLAGELWLIEDSETRLLPGDCAAWPAGQPVGHCLENRGPEEARFLTIGSRRAEDVIHHPDHDLVTIKDGPRCRYLQGGVVVGERAVR